MEESSTRLNKAGSPGAGARGGPVTDRLSAGAPTGPVFIQTGQ